MRFLSRALGLLIFIGSFFLFGLGASVLPAQEEFSEEQVDADTDHPKDEPTALEKADKLWGENGSRLTRLNLEECIDWALNYNPEINAADFSIEEFMAKKVGASRIGHPIVEYEYTLAPAPKDASDALGSFFSGDLTVFNRVKVGVGIPLYTFGKVKTGKNLAQKGIEAEQEKKTKEKAETILNIKQLYFGMQLAREVRHLLDSALKQVKEEITKKEEKGGSDPSELLKLRLFLAALEKRIDEGDKREILAHEALRVVLGMDRNVRFDIASSRLFPVTNRLQGFEKYRELAQEGRSDLKLLEIGYAAKAQELKLEQRLMTPNLALGAFFEFGHAPFVRGTTATDDFNNPFNFTRAGLGLQLKGSFDYHNSFAKVRELKSELAKTDLMRNHATRGIDLEIKEAYLEVQNTKQGLDRAEEAGKLSRQLLFLTQSNFDIGLAEPKDLIDAISSFLQTRGEYFEAVFNYNVAWGKLHQKIGLLPSSTQGNLPTGDKS